MYHLRLLLLLLRDVNCSPFHLPITTLEEPRGIVTGEKRDEGGKNGPLYSQGWIVSTLGPTPGWTPQGPCRPYLSSTLFFQNWVFVRGLWFKSLYPSIVEPGRKLSFLWVIGRSSTFSLFRVFLGFSSTNSEKGIRGIISRKWPDTTTLFCHWTFCFQIKNEYKT